MRTALFMAMLHLIILLQLISHHRVIEIYQNSIKFGASIESTIDDDHAR
jgi:hypothetical protein